MKRRIFLSCVAALTLNAWAAPRSENAAREIARQFLMGSSIEGIAKAKAFGANKMQTLTLAGTDKTLLGANDIANAKGMSADNKPEALYVYNLGNDAFVIVSGDDQTEPVLAYSYDGAFTTENMPKHIKAWMQTYADEIAYINKEGNNNRVIGKVSSDVSSRTGVSYPDYVAPLLKYQGESIAWDQNSPFNDECPNYNGYRSVAGCVATAMSQIMYYHRWPNTCLNGTKSYFTYTYNIAQNMTYNGLTFDWNNMLPAYKYGAYNAEQAAEVAKLVHAVGVAVEMDYAPEGSGTTSLQVGTPMVKFFNYDKNLHYAMRDYFDLDEWISMIKEEISNGRPICYAGTSTSIGHQFIFDGYDENNMVHVNWGWAGMSDGFFRLSALAPSATGTGGGSVTSGGFIYNQGMWLGLQRPTSTSIPCSFYIIHEANVVADKETLLPGENLTLSTTNYYNASLDFDGQIGLVVETEDGNQYVLAQKASKLVCGAGFLSQDGTPVISLTGAIPTDMKDGKYQVYLATQSLGEPDWKRIRADYGYNDRFEANVADGKITITPMVIEPEATGSLTPEHALYTRCRSHFTAKLTNTTPSEYFGMAHVVVYEEENGVQTPIGEFGSTQVSLPVGQEVEVQFSGSVEAYQGKTISAGDYKACVCLEHQDKLYQVGTPIDIEVKRMPSGMASVKAITFSADKDELGLDETLTGKIKVTNTRSVYSGNIGIILFPEKSSMGTCIWEGELFLETDDVEDIPFSVPVQWEPGKYKAELRYNEYMQSSDILANFSLTIKDEYTDIEETVKDISAPARYYTLDGKSMNTSPEKGVFITRKGDKVIKIVK